MKKVKEEKMEQARGHCESYWTSSTYVRVKCLPRPPDCRRRNNPENFNQQVFGEGNWGSSQTSVRDLD